MIVTTSATTVTSVTYLSLYELEQYKKQFQSFWIPFMEQFIPATTIWVAGERWCNDVCTIINPCDYDFELVESEVSYQEVPTGIFPTEGTTGGYKSPLLTTNVSTIGTIGIPIATAPTTSPNIKKITDLGLTNSTPIIKTVAETNIDILAYRNRFTVPTVETIVM